MRAERVNLAKVDLDKVSVPVGAERVFIYDTKTPGLAFRVTAKGRRAFYWYRSASGKPVKRCLGDYPGMSVTAARAAADSLNGQRSTGIVPAGVRRTIKVTGNTLADMWQTYRQTVTKSDRSWEEDEGNWRRYLEPWGGSLPVKSISVDAIQAFYNTVAGGKVDRSLVGPDGKTRTVKGGPVAANRTMALLSGMFSECGRTYGVPGYNPCSEVRKAKETPRDRYLSAEEFPAFWKALDGQTELIQDLFKLALFTGQRRANLQEMEWGEVNLTFNVWTIPAHKMKGRKTHTVPLVPQAVAILQRRKDMAVDGAGWVLASPGSATGHVQSPEHALLTIAETAGIAPVTLHDLRRTCATWMNSTGASEATIGAVLAHAHRGITGIYARATDDAKREALTKAAAAMEAAVIGERARPRPGEGVA